MKKEFSREIGIISEKQYQKLIDITIVLFGLGGVGGYTFEALVRAGIQNFVIIDKDKFEITNFNRQLEANINTLGNYKVLVYENRAKNINKDIIIKSHIINVTADNLNEIFKSIDINNSIYIIDCIDDIDVKVALAGFAYNNNLKIISSMGTANHISTDKIKITDINKTKYCPVAKIIRKKIKEKNIKKLTCLYIDEEVIKHDNNYLSTISYVPAICGLKIAEYVIKDILSES